MGLLNRLLQPIQQEDSKEKVLPAVIYGGHTRNDIRYAGDTVLNAKIGGHNRNGIRYIGYRVWKANIGGHNRNDITYVGYTV